MPLAVDLYVPVGLEAAELFGGAPKAVRRATLSEAAATLRLELTRADAVFCANERQRDLWTGAALAAGRDLGDGAGLVRVMPFGVPDELPVPGSPALKGVVDGVAQGDLVALWAGGLHEWFDPELVIEATARLAPELPRLRLVFLGVSPPNPALQGHSGADRARGAADRLGLTGKSVFFLEGWVPYVDRGRYLLEADIGVSAHHDTLETRYSWRTRLLDHAWAGLPTAATSGDELSERMAAAGAARLAAPGDEDGLAEAMRSLLTSEEARRAAAAAATALAAELCWSRVVRPLVEWAEAPALSAASVGSLGASMALWRMFAVKAAHVFRQEGVSGVLRRARRFSDRG